MHRRALGNTGITVSEMGLGGWQLSSGAWGTADGAAAPRIVAAALEAGCDFFDTAPGYGGGRSEELLGQTLRGVRDRVTICTKFGHGADGKSNWEVGAVRPSVEGSLRRLRTDRLDVVLLHNPPAEMMDGGRTGLYAELERLKEEGKVRSYGVSLDWRKELETVIETTGCGVVEVLFNAFHQEPLAAFGRARARGIGIIVKVPLDSGWLSGKYRKGAKFTGIRERWSEAVIARRADLVEKFANLAPTGMSMLHAALKYVLAQAEVSTVIPGAKTVEQARDNFAAAAGEPLPGEVVKAMYELWEREVKGEALPW